jgi:hypothetical protein
LTLFDCLSGTNLSFISTPAALFVQTLISQIQCSYPFVSYCTIFYNGALVYSQLGMEDTHALWVQLYGVLFPQNVSKMLSNEKSSYCILPYLAGSNSNVFVFLWCCCLLYCLLCFDFLYNLFFVNCTSVGPYINFFYYCCCCCCLFC